MEFVRELINRFREWRMNEEIKQYPLAVEIGDRSIVLRRHNISFHA